MATATGKTPVMAMLILYHTANHRNAAPDDHRFTRRFLVITPGLTVRERLQDTLDPRSRRQRLESLQPGAARRPVGADPDLRQRQRDQLPPAATQGHGADQHQAAAANCRRLQPDNSRGTGSQKGNPTGRCGPDSRRKIPAGTHPRSSMMRATTATGETPTRKTRCPRTPSGSMASSRYETLDCSGTSSTCQPHQSSWRSPTPGPSTG